MTVDYKIWNFPNVAVESQLFHVPGAFFDGGLTSGGARIMSPEPGGRSVLELTPAFRSSEWLSPIMSWLMSKINGEIFRIQMTKTPQLVSFSGETNYPITSPSNVSWDNSQAWDNGQNWNGDGAYLETTSTALSGSKVLQIETNPFGEIIAPGHVIGISDSSYIVEDIEYNGTVAKITVNPPLRTSVIPSDMVFLKPYFLGVIANGAEIRNSYDANQVGSIQLNRIIFNEVIL